MAGTDRVARYSRWVRWMKVLLPLGAVALIAAMFLIPRGRTDEGLTAAQIAALGAGLKLDNPRFTGATDDGEPYEVAAEWALPDGAVPDLIELHRPMGMIETIDHGEVTARADSGLFRREAETLELTGRVVIVTADGYRFETEAAEFDLGAGAMSAPGEVALSGPLGSIDAGSLRAADLGGADGSAGAARIWFENRVRVLIIPESER